MQPENEDRSVSEGGAYLRLNLGDTEHDPETDEFQIRLRAERGYNSNAFWNIRVWLCIATATRC